MHLVDFCLFFFWCTGKSFKSRRCAGDATYPTTARSRRFLDSVTCQCYTSVRYALQCRRKQVVRFIAHLLLSLNLWRHRNSA